MSVGPTVAKNVASRTHTINGTRVDVSFHQPSTRETQSQETSEDQVRLGHFMINLRPIEVFTSAT